MTIVSSFDCLVPPPLRDRKVIEAMMLLEDAITKSDSIDTYDLAERIVSELEELEAREPEGTGEPD